MPTTRELLDTVHGHGHGEVTTIVVRPGRREPATAVAATTALTDRGLRADRHSTRANPRSTRQVTLLQAEHLPVIASLAGIDEVDPRDLRRNLVVSGLNLLSAKGRRLQVGDAVLEVTGPCHPCSRMEEALGPGGFQAMRGHGGMNAKVVGDGDVSVGSVVRVLPPIDPDAPPPEA